MSELTTEEVARRLGVRPETVYAYVSRGLLTSQRNADGKQSRFDRAEVEALARTGRRSTPTRAAIGALTEVTEIVDGRPRYRGRDVCELARTQAYEAVVGLLWTGAADPVDFVPAPGLTRLAGAVTAPLPPSTRLTDRLHLIVAAAAAADPLRFDTGPAAVRDTGRMVIATMVDALPRRGRARGARTASLAERLWRRLTPAAPDPAGVRALNGALVLLADHDLAASTIAARVAASTRAHPYAVVSAGLAALDGPVHGAASALAYRLLAETAGTDPIRVLSERLRDGQGVPGFGQPLYPDGDPRAVALRELLADLPPDPALADRIGTVEAAMRDRTGRAPNIDFALAELALRTGMGAEAGEVVFAVARTAGWIAHALEEYANPPNRFRPFGTTRRR